MNLYNNIKKTVSLLRPKTTRSFQSFNSLTLRGFKEFIKTISPNFSKPRETATGRDVITPNCKPDATKIKITFKV